MSKYSYSPQISPGNNDVTPMPADQPVITNETSVIFTYPLDDPTLTVELKRPDIGNSFVLSMTNITRRSRGGTLIQYRDTNWTMTETLTLSFSNLSESKADDLESFLAATIGRKVGYRDHEGRQWQGFIMNPTSPFIQKSRFCGFSIDLTFEGEVV